MENGYGYVNKSSLKYMITSLFSHYKKSGIECVEIEVVEQDLFDAIDTMSFVNLEAVVKKIEELVGGVK